MNNIKWVCTDLDNQQYGRKINNGHYEFKELNRNTSDYEKLDEWIEGEVVLSNYTDSQIQNHLSAYYDSIQEVKDTYGDNWEWIVAECIFEQESGLY